MLVIKIFSKRNKVLERERSVRKFVQRGLIFCKEWSSIYRHENPTVTGGGFFLGYSAVAKAFRVFNILRQEMEETYHVTFNKADEVITQTSTGGDEIKFNENKSFPDDEFLVPRCSHSQSIGNDDHLPYVPVFVPFSTNNIIIPGTLFLVT
ncbi:hypothetical protein Tco_1492127 [Tanacetum coccineum]